MSASTVPAVREQTSQQSGPTRVPASPYHLSIGYLRAFITLLVVAHFAALAYIRFAPQPPSRPAQPASFRAPAGGAVSFLRDRALRLGLPLKTANSPSAFERSGSTAGKACQMRGSVREGLFRFCPRSTPWRALSFLLLPRWAEFAGRLFPGANRHSVRFFAVLTVLSGAAYVPLAVRFNRFRWSAWGRFTFQASRALHYLVSFVL